MAVVPICYKMSINDRFVLHSKQLGHNQNDFDFAKYCFYSTYYSLKRNMWNTRQFNVLKREKRFLVCDATKSKSAGKQLESLDSYFQKLKVDGANESSSVSPNKNEEFLERGDPFEDYLGKVNKDEKFVSVAPSINIDTAEEVYLTRSSAKGEWKKLKDYVTLKADDDSELNSSDFYLIGILISINIAVFLFEIASPVQTSELELFSLPSIYGAKINHLILLGEWWRLVTPMFLVQD